MFASFAVAQEFSAPPINVPDGFTVELAAAPPFVRHPMMACFDERGRLFIAESQGKNLEKDGLLEQRGRFIRMLEDNDGDGRFDKSTIFADKLVMPEGALWHQGALYVLSSPYLWRFEDTDDDGIADRREKLVGQMEFNGKANQHGAYLGPNGRLYFSGGTFGYELVGRDGRPPIKGSSAGVFSCRADGTDVQVHGNGGINPVEVAFTPEGELITPCPIFDSIDGRHDALIHWVHGAIAGPRDYRPPVVKPTGYRLPALSRWGQVAPSGLMRYRGQAFGAKYENTLFTTLFNTATVVNTRLERMGATFRSYDEDFLTSPSQDFHPTDVLEDADGSLLVIDTGGWFRISCPESKVAKPQVLGAIYRIRRVGAKGGDDPRGVALAWADASSVDLAARLDDPRPVVRDRAIDTLSERGDDALAALESALVETSSQARRNAVWTLSRIGTTAATEALRRGLLDNDRTVRQAAVRSVGVLRDQQALSQLLQILTTDEPPLRRAAATALGHIGHCEAVPYLLRAAENGGDDFVMHSLVYALIEIGDFAGVLAGLKSSDPLVQHASLMALDQIAPRRLTQQHVAPLLDSDDVKLRQATLAIVASRDGWSDQTISFLEKWRSAKASEDAEMAIARGVLVAFGTDDRVQGVIRATLDTEETSAQVRTVVFESIGRLSQFSDAWVKPMRRLLQTAEDPVRLEAIHAIASQGTSKLDSDLLRVASDASTNRAIRAAAWGCLASRGAALNDQGFQLLLNQVTSDETPPLERLDAARAIAAAKLEAAQLIAVADRLPRVGPLELPSLIVTFERVDNATAELGRRILESLATSPGVAGLSPNQLRQVLAGFPEETRVAAASVLEKASVDETMMATRISAIREQLEPGNPEHGKVVFFSHRAACAACHRVAGEGGTIGPDLSHMGRIRTRQDLLESILFPSSSIANNYETFSAITTSGKSVQGVIHRATHDRIVLRNAQRQEVVLRREDIEDLVRSKTSIMPQGLDKAIRLDELSDLLAYLESLKP
jgi:putative membrane-bound dehydrogenase-like protein